MAIFDVSVHDLWDWSLEIFFYVYLILWIMVAYIIHSKSNQTGSFFSGLGSVIFFGFIVFFMLIQVLTSLKDYFQIEGTL